MLSSSDVVYDSSIGLNYILLSVTYNLGFKNESNLKDTTVNNFALRHHNSIGVYTREHS